MSEEFYQDDFDYDYFGPNNDHTGFGGHGFGDSEENPYQKEFDPTPLDQTLEELKESNPEQWSQIFNCILFFARNRHLKLLRKVGESAGLENIIECIEDDINSGYCKLMNTIINGINRCCLFDFNVYTGQYYLSADSYEFKI